MACKLEGIQFIGRDDKHGGRGKCKSTEIRWSWSEEDTPAQDMQKEGMGLNLGKKKGKEMRRKTGALVDPQTGERTVESVGLNSKDNLWN